MAGRRTCAALWLGILLPTSAVGAVLQAQPVPRDGGVFRADPEPGDDGAPAEVFERVKEGIGRQCQALDDAGVRDYYRVSFRTHALLKERSGLAPAQLRPIYQRYLARLCERLSSAHPPIGATFPYVEIELFMSDSTTQLCDLEARAARPALLEQLEATGDPRLPIVRRLCQRDVLFSRSPQQMREAFATAMLDEHCLARDTTATEDPSSFALPEGRQAALPDVCAARSPRSSDVDLLQRLWGDDGGGGDDSGGHGILAAAAVLAALGLLGAARLRARARRRMR